MVIADTAGRLHNKANLMAELSKISRSVKKASPESSLETLLVLDAITGQNAISQAKEFCKAASATGIILTKLDGTAKGGCVVAVKQRLGLPVRFIGVGEGIDDLLPVHPGGLCGRVDPPHGMEALKTSQSSLARCQPLPFRHFRATSPGRGSLSQQGSPWQRGRVLRRRER